MRTVILYLRDATVDQVRQYLDSHFPGPRDPWLVCVDGDPCLYINVECEPEFADAEDKENLLVALGGACSLEVWADVSGRHPGDPEVREFVSTLLSQFAGVANDDSRHYWTAAEIAAGQEKGGHPFFDYRGDRRAIE